MAEARPAALRGLLIDFGGVLTSSLFGSFAAFCRSAGLPEDSMRRLFREPGPGQDLLVAYECGRLADADYERELGVALGLQDTDGLIGRLMAGLDHDEAMFAAVEAAHDAGVRTGLISNSWGTHGYDLERFGRMFDAQVISGEEGIRKPAPEIYAIAVRRLGVPAHECVFVDDLGGNLKPAAAMGMATVKHVNAAETIATLEGLLGIQLGSWEIEPSS